MRHAGMVWLLGEDRLQDLGGFELIGVGLIGRQRCGVQGQGIEDRRFCIIWIVLGELFHSRRIGQRARAVIHGVSVLIESCNGGNIGFFARCLGSHCRGLLDRCPAIDEGLT